jgi:alpha-methylacyl-CoA racemase
MVEIGAGTGPGPLRTVRVLQLAGLGPIAFCGQVLSDLGADVIRVDPPAHRLDAGYNARGRRSVVIDLKRPEGLAAALSLVQQADVLVEGFRPGVAERLGIGPAACLDRNGMLVYGRCSGWGRRGRSPTTPGMTSATSHSPARFPCSARRGSRRRHSSDFWATAAAAAWHSPLAS